MFATKIKLDTSDPYGANQKTVDTKDTMFKRLVVVHRALYEAFSDPTCENITKQARNAYMSVCHEPS